jgi:hypothetical protein
LCLYLFFCFFRRLPDKYYRKLQNTDSGSSRDRPSTSVDPYFSKRIFLLHNLHEKYGFENVLERCRSASETDIHRSEQLLRINLNNPYGSDVRNNLLLTTRKKIALGVAKKVQWFKKRIAIAINAGWNVQALWQQVIL